MRSVAIRTALRLGRVVSLVMLAVLGTSALMYAAPGYFAEAREMDAAYASGARSAREHMQAQQSSLGALLRVEISGWAHGDMGRSRQYDVPVASLLPSRLKRSATLLGEGMGLGWMLSVAIALPFSVGRARGADFVLSLLTALLLAVPVGVLGTVCLLSAHGEPALVLALVVAAKDCKVLYRILGEVWTAPFVAYARAQGLRSADVARIHLLPVLRREVQSLALLSFTLALSALVPTEVIFDSGGLGQLAWSAAMNRDLPVLVVVTAIMSAGIGAGGALLGSGQRRTVACA